MISRVPLAFAAAIVWSVALAPPTRAQELPTVESRNDSIRVRLANTDLRAAVQALGRFLAKPVLMGAIGEKRVEAFETPIPVPRSQLPEILRGLAEAHGLVFTEDSTFYRLSPPEQAPQPPARAQGQRTNVDSVGPPIRLFTVRLKHARAADVAATLNQLYGTGARYSRSPGLSRGTLSDELRDAREAEAQSAEPVEEGSSIRGNVTIVPDELTNSLLIRASEIDYQVLEEGIAQLDVRPLQVLIEVVVVEARKDRQFSIGLDVELPPHEFGDGQVAASLVGAGLGDLAVRVMNLGKEDVNAALGIAKSKGDAEIISRPVLIASNNTEATLLVGTQQPFVQVSRSLPTDTPQRDQVVQYRDVGTKLSVLPTINQDGYVSLLIQQEISSATGETQFSAPVISSREATTQVLVADGQTIVIGGLRDRVHDEVRTGIPLLSDIPLLGGLFGGMKTRTTETELYVFITPTILGNDAEVDAATEERLPGVLRRERPDTTAADSLPIQPDSTRNRTSGGRRP